MERACRNGFDQIFQGPSGDANCCQVFGRFREGTEEYVRIALRKGMLKRKVQAAEYLHLVSSPAWFYNGPTFTLGAARLRPSPKLGNGEPPSNWEPVLTPSALKPLLDSTLMG